MKTSLSTPNIANAVADLVASRFPALASAPIDGCWFTGSQIWTLLYPDHPVRVPSISDWDIFCEDEAAGAAVVARLGLVAYPACKTCDKRHDAERTVCASNIPVIEDRDEDSPPGSYNDGFSYSTPDGEVDVWISRPGTVVGELRTYPIESHAHCRIAFSFTDGLVILPNDALPAPPPSDAREDIDF